MPGNLIEFSLSLKSNGFTRIFLRHINYSPQYSVNLDSGLIWRKFSWILVLNITSYSLFQVSSSGTPVILMLNLPCLTSISTTFSLICFTYFLILFSFSWLFIFLVPCFLLFLLLVWLVFFFYFFFRVSLTYVSFLFFVYFSLAFVFLIWGFVVVVFFHILLLLEDM